MASEGNLHRKTEDGGASEDWSLHLGNVADQAVGLVPATWCVRAGPARVPSARECGFCDISSADCLERVAGGTAAEGVTEDF